MSRSKIDKFLNNYITIYKKTSTQDRYGGVKSIWEKNNWGIKGRIYGLSGVYKITFEGKDYDISNKLVCGKDVSLAAGDKVVDNNTRGTYIAVKVYPVDTAKKLSHIEALLARIAESEAENET